MGLLVVLTSLFAAAAQVDTAALEAKLLDRAEKNRQSFEANHDLGEFYIQRHRLSSAIPYLERAHSIDPKEYNNSYDLALAYLESGKVEQSRQVIEAMLAVKDTAELHNLLGDVEAAESNVDAAARQYEVAARADPSEKNMFDLGSFLAGHRGFEQARIVFEYAVGRYPKAARLRVGLGVAYYSLGQYDQAVEALCQAVDLDPKDTKALDFLGKMYDISPAYADEVTKRLARFVKIYPENAAANYFYALSLRKRRLGTPDNAKSAELYLARAVKLNPGWADAHYELGLLYEDQHDYSRAIAEYEAAEAIEPATPKTHYRLAVLYRRNGQPTLAEREMHAFEASKGKKPD
jgi:tetratricopeptide (TPR) repeat protein